MKKRFRAPGFRMVIRMALLCGASGAGVPMLWGQGSPDAAAAGMPGAATSVSVSAGVKESVPTQSGETEAPPPPNHELLLSAVGQRRLLQFVYHDRTRLFEPYAYGRSSSGEAMVHGYQVAGGSGAEPTRGWRNFTVAAMRDVVLTERRFTRPRDGYSPERFAFDPLWARVGVVSAAEGAGEPDGVVGEGAGAVGRPFVVTTPDGELLTAAPGERTLRTERTPRTPPQAATQTTTDGTE